MNTILTIDHILTALRCPRQLYLGFHQNTPANPGRIFKSSLLAENDLILKNALPLFPRGRWAEQQPTRLEHTRTLVADHDTPAIYGGEFQAGGLQVRADLLWRNRDGSWDIFLARAGTWVKIKYLWSLAICQYTLGQDGLDIRHAGLIYPNTDYQRPQGDPLYQAMFHQEDCMDRTVDLVEQIPSLLESVHRILASPTPPDSPTGSHCRQPGPCRHEPICRPERAGDWIGGFYRMSESRKKKLLAQGLVSIRELPDTEKLTTMQKRIRDAHLSGQPFLDPKFGKTLSALPHPLHYLDFETAAPAVPLHHGDRPYDLVPFQWSLHLEYEDPPHPIRLDHKSYLAEGRVDPRPEFIRSLIAAVSEQGAILTYTNYERQVLLALAGRYPQYAPPLVELAERCVDLCALVRRYLYHPGFGQSFSLKNVLPALAPELDYHNLDIGEGLMAGRAFLNLVMETEPHRRRHIRRALLEYCGHDTLAMVVIKRYALGQTLPSDQDLNLDEPA